MAVRRTILVWAAVLLMLGFVAAGEKYDEQKYNIDRSHSNITFSVKHMLVATVRGSFNEFEGSIHYDPDDIMSFSAEGVIKTNSIDTNHERRDNDLRSDNFFDVEKYPEIRFKTNKVIKKDDGTVALGELTIKDVTKEVEIPFEVTGPIEARRGLRIGVDAYLTINRRDYNILWDRTMDNGGLVVSNEVRIELNIEAAYRPPREGN